MMTKITLLLTLLFLVSACQKSSFTVRPLRNPAQDTGQAMNYLDARTADWLATMQSDGGKCLSCHTTLPYSLVRPSFGDTQQLKEIRKLIETRVKFYTQEGFLEGGTNTAWYTDEIQKSFSNEAVLNAVSLVYMDKGKNVGNEKLTALTKKALKLMWTRQEVSGAKKGGFQWLDYFGLKPFESKGADYWGAGMVAVAVGEAPEGYKNSAEIQENLKELKKYLKKDLSNQTLHNQLMTVWADYELGGGIISETEKKKIINKVLATSEASGGWSIHSLFGETAQEVDGYATGFVTNIMMKLGYKDHVNVKKGLKWIRSSQNVASTGVLPDGTPGCGSWFGSSLNSGVQSTFMTDLSTSYAILALQTASKMGI